MAVVEEQGFHEQSTSAVASGYDCKEVLVIGSPRVCVHP